MKDLVLRREHIIANIPTLERTTIHHSAINILCVGRITRKLPPLGKTAKVIHQLSLCIHMRAFIHLHIGHLIIVPGCFGREDLINILLMLDSLG
jgi:hypothetical protein